MSALSASHVAYKLPSPRLRVQDLHGPHDGDRTWWSAPERATERWEHGQLRAVASLERLRELQARWGLIRTQGARVGPEPMRAEPHKGAEELLGPRTWRGMLRRAFDHVGCKAAQVGAMSPDALRSFEAVGEAIWQARARPRGPALERLLAVYNGDHRALFKALDSVDRALDAALGQGPWIFDQAPAHCLRLWPLRNVMRLAERQGVLFRRMRFSDFEAEDSFVPDLPVVCLDEAIYGGGFDHDLFHHLLPVAPPDDSLDFEASMLVVESAAQAYNSLVLASRYDGPPYEGHAPWSGEALFERLTQAFGPRALPELISAYARLGLVCHPELDADPVALWTELVGGRSNPDALASLVEDHARYIRLDAGWLRTLRPRYEAPVMAQLRGPLQGRLAPSAQALVSALDETLWALEDLDLRTHDFALIGHASSRLQRGRWAWFRAQELQHLIADSSSAQPGELSEVLKRLEALDADQSAHLEGCLAMLLKAPAARDATRTDGLIAAERELEARVEEALGRVEALANRLRSAQRAGDLQGPTIPEDFIATHRELFVGVEYEMPIHLGADGPGAPP